MISRSSESSRPVLVRMLAGMNRLPMSCSMAAVAIFRSSFVVGDAQLLRPGSRSSWPRS